MLRAMDEEKHVKQKSEFQDASPPLTLDQRSGEREVHVEDIDQHRSYEFINDQNEGMEVIAGISHAGIIGQLAKKSTGPIES